GANLVAVLLNEVEGYLHRFARERLNFPLRNRPSAFESPQEQGAERGGIGEYLVNRLAQHVRPPFSQKALERSADQSYPTVAGEQHRPILQLSHGLIDVVFESGKD